MTRQNALNTNLLVDTNTLQWARDTLNVFYDGTNYAVILGWDAGNIGTATGDRNIIIGQEAGFSLTSGYDDVLLGGFAGRAVTSGYWNVGIGYDALRSLSTGYGNIGIGYQAQRGNTNYSCAVGYQAGQNNTGEGNCFFGRQTGPSTTGSSIAIFGQQAGFKNTSGGSNSAFGAAALYDNLTGFGNTAIGKDALGNTTASYNTGLGADAGEQITSGTGNTALGASSGPSSATPTISYSVALGYGAETKASNQMVVGGITGYINDIIFGKGVSVGTPVDVTLQAGGALGTNQTGADFILAGGKGTGDGAGGSLLFKTPAKTTSGTDLQSLSQWGELTWEGRMGWGSATPTQRFDIQAITDANNYCRVHTAQTDYSVGYKIQRTGATNASEWTIYVKDGETGLTFFNDLVSSYNSMVLGTDGSVTMPGVYDDTITGNMQDLYIDENGKLGYVSSSISSKTDLTPAGDVSWLYQLTPKNYKYIDEGENAILRWGLIAEDVHTIKPEMVCIGKDGNPASVVNTFLIVPLLKAVQELNARITVLEASK